MNNIRMNNMERKTGTREWAELSYNIGIGCAHNCRYCYAKVGTEDSKWTHESIKTTFPKIPEGNGESTVMIPTQHDITPYYVDAVIESTIKLIEANNKVLIVSKPHIECVTKMANAFEKYKESIIFRFTIGSLDQAMVDFWEPNAPSVNERINCLSYIFSANYQTSVSMEPMLSGTWDCIKTFIKVEPFVTDKIWIGKMNKIDDRVLYNSPEVSEQCDIIKFKQSDSEILRLVSLIKHEPKVEWKDSIKEVIERYNK